MSVMLLFAPLFSKSVWESAVVLVIGAILAPGKRTVSAMSAGDGASVKTPTIRTTIECSTALFGLAAKQVLFYYAI